MTEPSWDSAKLVSEDWLLVDASDPTYADAVIKDLGHMMDVRSGLALLRRLNAFGRRVVIVRPDPTDPPNAWIKPRGRRAAPAAESSTGETNGGGKPAASAGTASDITLAYDPNDWPSPAHPGSPTSDAILFALLHEGCRYIEGTVGGALHRAGALVLYDAAEVHSYQSERDHA